MGTSPRNFPAVSVKRDASPRFTRVLGTSNDRFDWVWGKFLADIRPPLEAIVAF
jgi:hypothetical protein